MSYKKRSSVRAGLSYVRNLVKSHSKAVVTCAIVGLTMASARADILSYDEVTGATSWDLSGPTGILVGVACLAVTAGMTIWGIVKGVSLIKRFIR